MSTAQSRLNEVGLFAKWAKQNENNIVAAMLASGVRTSEQSARICLADHLSAISNLGVILCANRVRELTEYASLISGAPLPSDEAIAYLYDYPLGKAAASPRY